MPPRRGTKNQPPQHRVYHPGKRHMELIASVSRSSGLEKDGDALRDPKIQEEYRDFIQGKVDEYWTRYPRREPREPSQDADSLRNMREMEENLLILFRKLREGLLSSQRRDPFALEVYETSLHLSVLFRSPAQTTSTLSHLFPDLYIHRSRLPVPPASISTVSENSGQPSPSSISPEPAHPTIAAARSALPTALIFLLHHLVASYPSQIAFHTQLRQLHPSLQDVLRAPLPLHAAPGAPSSPGELAPPSQTAPRSPAPVRDQAAQQRQQRQQHEHEHASSSQPPAPSPLPPRPSTRSPSPRPRTPTDVDTNTSISSANNNSDNTTGSESESAAGANANAHSAGHGHGHGHGSPQAQAQAQAPAGTSLPHPHHPHHTHPAPARAAYDWLRDLARGLRERNYARLDALTRREAFGCFLREPISSISSYSSPRPIDDGPGPRGRGRGRGRGREPERGERLPRTQTTTGSDLGPSSLALEAAAVLVETLLEKARGRTWDVLRTAYREVSLRAPVLPAGAGAGVGEHAYTTGAWLARSLVLGRTPARAQTVNYAYSRGEDGGGKHGAVEEVEAWLDERRGKGEARRREGEGMEGRWILVRARA